MCMVLLLGTGYLLSIGAAKYLSDAIMNPCYCYESEICRRKRSLIISRKFVAMRIIGSANAFGENYAASSPKYSV